MYNKTSVDILTADTHNDTYTKTEIDSTLSACTNPTDLHNGFYSKAKMSIILDTYCNITEIQANDYIKTEIGPLFSNIDLNNYYTKAEIDDIHKGLSTLILNTCTKTEVYTLLYTNYPSLSFIADNSYGKTYLDNKFSLKADVPQLAELVTTGYLTTKYTNSV